MTNREVADKLFSLFVSSGHQPTTIMREHSNIVTGFCKRCNYRLEVNRGKVGLRKQDITKMEVLRKSCRPRKERQSNNVVTFRSPL